MTEEINQCFFCGVFLTEENTFTTLNKDLEEVQVCKKCAKKHQKDRKLKHNW